MIGVMKVLNDAVLSKVGVHLEVQVGIHSGSAIAGVLGHKTVQYDLCGDAVNTAARMCSYSLPGHVHISEATHELVRDTFSSVCRGERAIKGKGNMRTYFLLNVPTDQTEIMLQHRVAPSPMPPPKSEVFDPLEV